MKYYYPCMKTCLNRFLFLVAWLLLSYFGCQASGISIDTHDDIQCIAQEREALLKLKQGIERDGCGLLTSWTDHERNRDCCEWHRVSCNNHTGHVITLDLHGSYNCWMVGNINRSLLELKHLQYLDLSYNDFRGQAFPSFIGSLHRLTYLNISNAEFVGEIPHQLGNLTRLAYLELNSYYNNRSNAKSLEWLSHLTLLRETDLSWIDLSEATDWMHSVKSLPLLRVLHMDSCNLFPPPILPSLSYHVNSSSTLRVLSLSTNNLKILFGIFWRAFNLTGSNSHLEYVDLSKNYLIGPIPIDLQNMISLLHLDLSHNTLEGPIPAGLVLLPRLASLDLSHNHLTGVIPPRLGTLSPLNYISLSYNNLSGQIPSQFGNFSFISFYGNLDLCGEPLSWLLCPQVNASDGRSSHGNKGDNYSQFNAGDSHPSNGSNKEFYEGIYVSIGVGLYVGFCTFFGT